jgi:hypothetical protein
MCGGTKKKLGRCKPCFSETPKPGGRAWCRWTNGIRDVVRARLAALPESAIIDTWTALLLDRGEVPEGARAIVADIAAIPFSARRYQRSIERALLASFFVYDLGKLGVQREADDARDPQRDLAHLAAARVQVEEDRRGEELSAVERAGILVRAVLEHYARKKLTAQGLRGAALERAVTVVVDRQEASFAAEKGQRFAIAAARIEVLELRVSDGDAEEEAAEAEHAEEARRAS